MAVIYKMTLSPQQDGYSVAYGYDMIRQQTGYVSRYRRAVKRNSHIVSVNWLTDKAGFQYLNAFYNVWSDSGEHFLLDLVVDGAELQEYRCWFTSAIQLSQVQGNAYWLSAELEVAAKKRNSDMDQVIILGVGDLINPLEQLANVDLPNALESI